MSDFTWHLLCDVCDGAFGSDEASFTLYVLPCLSSKVDIDTNYGPWMFRAVAITIFRALLVDGDSFVAEDSLFDSIRYWFAVSLTMHATDSFTRCHRS